MFDETRLIVRHHGVAPAVLDIPPHFPAQDMGWLPVQGAGTLTWPHSSRGFPQQTTTKVVPSCPS